MTPEQARREERHAELAAVAHSLTETERLLFLGKVARSYHRLAGADVADVLDLTTGHDMFLDRTELFFEQSGSQLPEGVSYAPLLAAHLIILMGWGLTPARVWAVLQRAGVVAVPRYPEVEVGLQAFESTDGVSSSVADGNTVLLRARAEQGMRAAGIPETVITEFRETVRRVSVPGQQWHVGDIAAWVTFVDRYTEMPRKVYDPTGDIAAVLYGACGTELSDVPEMHNLRSHFDMRSEETTRASLAAAYGREG